MNRLFPACALFGLLAMGCSTASNSGAENSNKAMATASPSATAAAQPSKPADTSQSNASANAQGDVTGAYFIKGNVPGEFSEIEHLSLATIDENGKPAPLNGFIRPKRRSAQDYKLVSPKLNGRSLTFSTATVSGVSYSFTGTFQKLDDFSSNPPPSDEVILKGKLTKSRDGNVVAESDVSFTYSAGG
ncbi:MAG TPA: hypothetical protein VJS44_05230 [Pyrinomonadaceae bacterium]|nr:hypothetical protein [Pyrinomonadaceae bacterium]